jgi:hypothetical protein
VVSWFPLVEILFVKWKYIMYVLLIIEEISMCGKKGLKFKKSEQSDFSDEIKTHLFN